MKKHEQPPERDMEAELRDVEARMAEFESQLQTGEFDLLDDEQALAKRRVLNERMRKVAKGRSDVQQSIKNVETRRMLWRILEIAGPNRVSPNISDPYMTAQNDGMRLVANAILMMLWDADPSVYARMQHEHASDLKTEQERRKKEQGEN